MWKVNLNWDFLRSLFLIELAHILHHKGSLCGIIPKIPDWQWLFLSSLLPFSFFSFSPSFGSAGDWFQSFVPLGPSHPPGAWFPLNIKRMNPFIPGQQGDASHSLTKAGAPSRNRLTGWRQGEVSLGINSFPCYLIQWSSCLEAAYLHIDSFIP